MTGKIFGIGLSKTGTTSLTRALACLGYRAAHYADHRRDGRGLAWLSGDFEADCLADYDAAVDLPVPACYAQLDARYPASKFILTVRGMTDWLESARQHWLRVSGIELPGDPHKIYLREARLAMYGCHDFNPARMQPVYESHVAGVQRYFEKRSGDLLTIDICGGEGWERLCPFLARPVPTVPFPWENRRLECRGGLPC